MPWVPNGFGADEDNSVAGGLGGYMAYPQPPTGPNATFNPSSITNPENTGQFGQLSFDFNNGTTYFAISNPGRSA